MNKMKIYLDTSVISHLKQDDAPDKMRDTLMLWDEIIRGDYDVYISDVAIEEIMNASEPKRSIILNHLKEINYNALVVDDEIETYARKLIEIGVLTAKSIDDCRHIGAAVINGCGMILSWNFSHIVRVKTINGVKYVNSLLGYNEVGIYSPSMIVKRGDIDG